MDEFLPTLLSSHPYLKRTDCLPIVDSGYRLIYGRDILAAFRLDVSFSLKRMIIRQLIVRADLRSQGLGTTITTYLKEECGRLGLQEIWLYAVFQDSARFWERAGFSLNNTHDECGGLWKVNN